jgi:alkanesulfonate monooxygenase SsuD/methylene tetrahydromethanopterin reductase-like flavin-dependent oxidoreductase (luciferase family)
VIIPVFSHPVRVAEEVAMVDVLSGGRFHLGVGRGYQRKEFAAMGVDQNESAPRFYESVEIIERLLSEEHVSYQGQFWSVDDVTVYPRPVQKKIRISTAVFKTQATFDWAVARGHGILAGNPYSIRPEIEASYRAYMEAMSRAGQEADTEQAWGLASTFVDSDGDHARTQLVRTTAAYMEQLERHGSVAAPDGSVPRSYEAHADAWWKNGASRIADVLELPSTLVGTPDEVIAKLNRMYEEFGFQNVIFTINMGGNLEQRDVLRCYETLAEKVFPAVRVLGTAQPVVA